MGCCSSSPVVPDPSENKVPIPAPAPAPAPAPKRAKPLATPNDDEGVPETLILDDAQQSFSPAKPVRPQPRTRAPHGEALNEKEGWGYEENPDYSTEDPKPITDTTFPGSADVVVESFSEGNPQAVAVVKAAAAAAAAKKNANVDRSLNASKTSRSMELDRTPTKGRFKNAPLTMTGLSTESGERMRISEEGVSGAARKVGEEEEVEVGVNLRSLSSMPKWESSITHLSRGNSPSRPTSGGNVNRIRTLSPGLKRGEPAVTWSPKEGNGPTGETGDTASTGFFGLRQSPLALSALPSIGDKSKSGRGGGGGIDDSSSSMRESGRNAFLGASLMDPADHSPTSQGSPICNDQGQFGRHSSSRRGPMTSSRVSPNTTPVVSPNAFSHSWTDVIQLKKQGMAENESSVDENGNDGVLPKPSPFGSDDSLLPTRATPVLSPPSSDGAPNFFPSPTRVFHPPSPSSPSKDPSPFLPAAELPRPATALSQRKPFWGISQQKSPMHEVGSGSPIQRFGKGKEEGVTLRDRADSSGGGSDKRGERSTSASQNSPLSKPKHRRHLKKFFTSSSADDTKDKHSRASDDDDAAGQDRSSHHPFSQKHSSREGSRKRYAHLKGEAGGAGGPSTKKSSSGSSYFFDSSSKSKRNKVGEGFDDMDTLLGELPQSSTDLLQVSSSTSSYRLGDEATTCSVELSQPTQYSMQTVSLGSGGGGGGGGVSGGGAAAAAGGMGSGGNFAADRMDSPLPRVLHSLSGGNDSFTDVFSLGVSDEGGKGEMIEQARARERLCAKEVDTRQSVYREAFSERRDVIAMYVKELFMLERSKKLRKFFTSRGEKLLRVTEMEERCSRKEMVRVCARQLRAWYDEWEKMRGRDPLTYSLMLQEPPSPKMAEVRENDHEKEDENH